MEEGVFPTDLGVGGLRFLLNVRTVNGFTKMLLELGMISVEMSNDLQEGQVIRLAQFRKAMLKSYALAMHLEANYYGELKRVCEDGKLSKPEEYGVEEEGEGCRMDDVARVALKERAYSRNASGRCLIGRLERLLTVGVDGLRVDEGLARIVEEHVDGKGELGELAG